MELVRLTIGCIVVFGTLAIVPAAVVRAVSKFEVDRISHWSRLAFGVVLLVHLKWGLAKACLTGCLLICCICAAFSVIGITRGAGTKRAVKTSRIQNTVRIVICFFMTIVSLVGIAGIYPSARVSISKFAQGQSAVQAIRNLEWEWPIWLLGSRDD